MNDETREQLSAYLDGALTAEERRGLEARLAASAELRGALEDLRSVSRAVKGLPKQPLPDGFLVRFQARRARGDAPRQDWVFLPPQARPVVAALSFGVVALVIWDKVTVPPQQEFLHPLGSAKVYESRGAPAAQLDLSRAAGAGGGGSDAKSLQIAGPAPEGARSSDDLVSLQDAGGGASLGAASSAAKSSVAVVRGSARAKAAGRPLAFGSEIGSAAGGAAGASAEPQLTDRTRVTMTEEERSARNEEMFGQLEKQKKKMGMTVLAKGEEGADASRSGFLGLKEPPAAPALHAPVPTMLMSAKSSGAAAAPAAAPSPDQAAAAGRLAPDGGLVFSDARSLASSWVLLGLPGDPPAADFVGGRLVIIKPSATKILSVTSGPDAVTVVYRSLLQDEESDPARDRVAPLPATPKTVLIYDASPR